MPQFKLRPRARQDLADIWRYTLKTWGVIQADTYIRDKNRTFHALAEQPYMGKDCEWIRPSYRKHPVGRHIIFYYAVPSGIEVIRVLHKRMEVLQHFIEK
jgi:toxin ParE1/3/4